MMTEQRILTRKIGTKCHHETLVTIDWSDVTPDQMMQMAQWALIHELQARYAKGDMEIPEKQTIKASEIVKEKPVMLLKFSPPPPKPIKFDKGLLEAFEGMTEDELKVLFGMGI